MMRTGTHRSRTAGFRNFRRRGITLIEVLVGLIVTAMVAGGTFTMLFSVNRGTENQEDRRQVIMRRFLLSNRMSSVFRTSDRLLAVGPDYLVLWLGDANGNGKPNLSEIQRLEWDKPTSTIWAYAAPANLDPAADTAYDLTANYNAVTRPLAGGSTFPGQVWATGITSFSVDTDNNPTVQLARMVRFEVTLISGVLSDTFSIINHLRRAPV